MPIWQIFGCNDEEGAKSAIKRELHKFNGNPSYLDYVTGLIFFQPLDKDNLAARLWIIGKYWLGRYPLSDKRLYGALEGVIPHFEDLKTQLAVANVHPLPCQESEINNLINQFASLLEWFSGNKYVFTAKFLHWSATGTFPIIDENAFRAIYGVERRFPHFVNDNLTTEEIRRNCIEDFKEDYKKVIKFYNKLMNELPDRFKVWLRKEDLKQQQEKYPYLARPNSILRILDKYFWEKGGGGGEPPQGVTVNRRRTKG